MKKIIDTNFGRMTVLTTDNNQGRYYEKHGKHINQEQIDWIIKLLNPIQNPVFLDVGANLGWFSFNVAHAIPSAEVLAFEPQVTIYECIEETIELNSFSNIKVYNHAVGRAFGEIEVPELDYNIDSNFGGVELGTKKHKEKIGQPYTDNYYSVPLVSIDDLKLNKVDFIKIDVESMEFEVLEGAKQTIEKFKPLLCVEFLKVNKADLEEYLSSLGYTFKNIARHDYVCIHKSLIPD